MKDRRSLKTESKGSSPAMTHSHLQMRSFAAADQNQSQQQSESSRRSDFNLASLSIQPKLTIGQPNDKYEQEADRVAAQVVKHISSPQVQETSAKEDEVQRVVDVSGLQKVMAAQEDVQMQGDVSAGAASADFESSLSRARGGGSPLGAKVRGQMESAMGADFSGVKIHTDNRSDQLNRSIQAKAFTTGNDIFFQQGAYNPSSAGGQSLIAHELTHTIQQGAATSQVQRIVTDEVDKLRIFHSYTQKNDSEDGYIDDEDKKYINNSFARLAEYNESLFVGTAPGKNQKKLLNLVLKELKLEIARYGKSRKNKLPFPTYLEDLEEICSRVKKEKKTFAEYKEIKRENLKYLGGGAVNTVYSTLFEDGWEAVWKEDQAELCNGDIENTVREAGIGVRGFFKRQMELKNDGTTDKPLRVDTTSQANVTLGNRNIAMYKLSVLLETGVIPRTERASVRNEAGVLRTGSVMNLEKGTELKALIASVEIEEKKEKDREEYTPAAELRDFHGDEMLMSKAAQRDMSNLQIIDAIAGQIDRHAGNIIVTMDERGKIIGLKGIDNDLAFGINTEADSYQPLSHNRGFPELIDHKMAESIKKIEGKNIEEALEGYLTKQEIDKTVERFLAVKRYVMDEENAKHIIQEWNKATFKTQMDLARARVSHAENIERLEPILAETTSRSYLHQHAAKAQENTRKIEAAKRAEEVAQEPPREWTRRQRQNRRPEEVAPETPNEWQRRELRGHSIGKQRPQRGALAQNHRQGAIAEEPPVLNRAVRSLPEVAQELKKEG
jgi:Domain of unknown function (DUF4157)